MILTRYRAYRLLWATTVLTQAAQWMMQIALGWLMLDVTNSAGWVGLIGVASGVPFLLVSIPSGVLIDRFDRRLTLLASQAGGAAVGVGLALVVVWGVVAPWHLLAAAFLNGAMLAANSAARQTLVPALVERAHLQSAIALMSAGQNATRIVGPSLAGVLIAAGGAGGAFLAQAGCLLLALASTALLPPAPAATSEVLALRRNLIDGLAYIARSAVLSGLMLLAIIPTVLVFPYVQFLPVYARDILAVGADGLGLLYTGSGVGAVIGSLAVASLASLRRRGLFMLVGLVVYGALVTSFAYSTWVPLSVGLLALTSGLGSACMAMNNTLLLMHVTEEVRGRVMGVYTLTWGLSSLGALPMGFLGDHVSVPLAIAAGALTSSLLTAALAVRSRTLRAL
ncbi:MAG: MFS transporter [Sphaerobacter sp.]|nr:MFS transporter [Sphaerobacter sp.]